MTLSISPGEAEGGPAKLLYRGAEADILLGSWSGRPAVYKLRRPLAYRLEALDSSIRRQRTVHEAGIIHEAKGAGVDSPFLYFVSEPDATIVMEFVEGRRMKDALSPGEKKSAVSLFGQLGRCVAKLHSAGIMHGDVTTANVIIRDGHLVLIDFGLAFHSTRLEDRAVDLRLIKETIIGAHSALTRLSLSALFEGYGDVAGEKGLKAAQRQLREIERRGRYARAD